LARRSTGSGRRPDIPLAGRSAPGRFFGLIPLGGERVYCFGQLNADALMPEPPEGRLAHFQATFADFAAWVATALGCFTSDAQLHFGPVHEVEEPNWRARRVLLIGGAAHACSPILAQGGAMALEDAVVLSSMLADGPAIPDDWEGVLDAFVARRRPRVEWVRQETHRRIDRAITGPTLLENATAIEARRAREAFEPLKVAPVNRGGIFVEADGYRMVPPVGEPAQWLDGGEPEAAALVSQGKTNGQIADELVVSKRTVESTSRTSSPRPDARTALKSCVGSRRRTGNTPHVDRRYVGVRTQPRPACATLMDVLGTRRESHATAPVRGLKATSPHKSCWGRVEAIAAADRVLLLFA
jgi:hypothetical protein